MSSPSPSVAKQALLALEQMRERLAAVEQAAREPVAIVGIGLRVPGAANPEAFWTLLREGVDATSEIPSGRWDVDAYYDPDPDAIGKIYTKRGGFIGEVDAFDAEFFGVSPREAKSMDPQHRLLLEVAWEAVEHAGIAPADLSGTRTGVFVGITVDDYLHLLVGSGEAKLLDAYAHHGNVLNAAAGRLSYTLGLHGPSMAIDTACSSSLVAIHTACQSLRARDCDMALAGGVNLMLSPLSSVRLARGHMLAPDGRCKTFDDSADGYARGEGCGVLALKRLSQAQADGNRVLAVIRGSSVNQDGHTSALTVPNGLAQRAVIRDALANAGLEPGDVAYVEAHGTGTSLGDPIEMDAIADVLGRSRRAPLLVGSVKTNIGHLESASGVAGVIKVALALRHGQVPPHLHFQTPSRHIPWSELNIVVPTQAVDWPVGARRVAGISSFGASGTNAHLLLEQAPAAPAPPESSRSQHVLVLSAESGDRLQELAARYERLLEGTAGAADDICYTAAVGRSHFVHRASVVGSSVQELRAGAGALAGGRSKPNVQQGLAERGAAPKIAFLFTGQGSQYWGMGRELFDAEPVFRQALEECDRALQPHLDVSLLTLLYDEKSLDAQLLDRTAYTQPAIFAIEYALAQLLASWGIVPAAVMGHSVGEYAAACAAGVFTLPDAARLIAVRGRLMQALAGGGAMVAIASDEAAVRGGLSRHARTVAIAAVNAPDQIVLSGERSSLQTLLDDLGVPEPERRWLVVSHAFHSPLMQPMLDAFESEAAKVVASAPAVPFVSNLTGESVHTLDAAYWRRHAAMPVRFADGIKSMAAAGCSLFIEVGPTPALLALAQRTLALQTTALVPTLRRGRGDANQVARALGSLYVAGAAIDWRAVHGNVRRQAVTLPTYPFARERHWIDVAPAAGKKASAASMGGPAVCELVWRRTARAAESQGSPQSIDRWVVLTNGTGPGAAVSDALRRRSWPVVTVSDAEEIAAVSRSGPRDGKGATAFVHAWDGGSVRASELTADGLRDYARQACGSLLSLVQSIARAGAPARLFILTSGAIDVAAGKSLETACQQSLLWGLSRTIAREQPELQCVAIDLDASVAAAEQADGLLTDLGAGHPDSQVAYRANERYVARLAAVHADSGRPPVVLSSAATYLVTGGAGGAGLATVEWLAAHGARHVALMGRSQPAAEIAVKIRRIEAARGVTTRIVRADVADERQLASVLAELGATMPPVRGIVHAAAVLADGVLLEQTWPQFERVLAGKAIGAWNLHTATRHLPLDFFVLFSSFAGLAGSAGQANYTAANAFLDGLAQYRRACGLPATSVAWGPWQVGMLASLQDAQRERWHRQGLHPMAPERALSALDAAISGGRAAVAVLDVDWAQFLAANRRERDPLFDELAQPARAPERAAAPAAAIEPGDLFDRVAAAPLTRRRALLVEAIDEQARGILGAGDGRRLDPRRPLRELGMDSLMAIEIRNACGARLGRTLPATLLFDYPAIEHVADYVLRTFFEVRGTAQTDRACAKAPGDVRRGVNVEDLDNLSADEAEKLLLAELNAAED